MYLRIAVVCVLCALLGLRETRAGRSHEGPGPPSRTVEEAMGEVEQAFRSGDGPGLRRLAARDQPPLWVVADRLRAAGSSEAALALAQAAPMVVTGRLEGYVLDGPRPEDEALFALCVESDRALKESRPRDVLDLLRGEDELLLRPSVRAVSLHTMRGEALLRLSAPVAAGEAFLAAVDDAEALGWPVGLVRALHRGGHAWRQAGEPHRARALEERALALARRTGRPALVADGLGGLGRSEHRLGHYAEAVAAFAEEIQLRLGQPVPVGLARVAGDLGLCLGDLGDHPAALALLERSLQLFAGAGDRSGEAWALWRIADAQLHLGDFDGAILNLDRALDIVTTLGERASVPRILQGLGNVYLARGDYASALRNHERAFDLFERAGSRRGRAAALMNLGAVWLALADHEQALSCLEASLTLWEAVEHLPNAARCLETMGLVLTALGEFERAYTCNQRARARHERVHSRAGLARTSYGMAYALQRQGNCSEAMPLFDEAREAAEAVEDVSLLVEINIATAHCRFEAGDTDVAIAYLADSKDRAEEAGALALQAAALGGLVEIHLAKGQHAEAIQIGHEAVDTLRFLAAGLADEQGARIRERYRSVLGAAARAAIAEEDPAETAFFLESGRAGALLDALQLRPRLTRALLSPELGDALAEARAAKAVAAGELSRAIQGGRRAVIRARRDDHDRALADLATTISRIQREEKAAADLLFPAPASLTELQAALGAGEALVLYFLDRDLAAALVVERADARVVLLGDARTLEPVLGIEDPKQRVREPLARLRARLVKPLEVDPDVTRILVSPMGWLGYVPFALLFENREVVLVPSGTTYAHLRQNGHAPGDGVLALGDPDYHTDDFSDALAVYCDAAQCRRLTPLPETREEAQVVGTVCLLGKDATPAGLAAALMARERWRAVHFACHGLVDPERPTLSALALAPDSETQADGFLTCLDIYRMHIPADLVVLSGCETGRGKIYQAEGIVGLTRAFMVAGAPRVLCSLWKVDDEATRALMTEFYALWAPPDPAVSPLPAAAALKAAQEHVLRQPRWRHPYYWAGWVLWGLGD